MNVTIGIADSNWHKVWDHFYDEWSVSNVVNLSTWLNQRGIDYTINGDFVLDEDELILILLKAE